MYGPSQSNPKVSVLDNGRNCAPVAQPGSTPSGASGIVVKRCREVRLTPLVAPMSIPVKSCWRSSSARSASARTRWRRSEEHTSELQSRMRNSYAVFCLKKKNKEDKKRIIEQHEHY